MRQVIRFAEEQYEKMSDDIYPLGMNAILRFNTIFASKSQKDDTRYYYYKEYEFQSNKYNIDYNLRTIRRSVVNCYLSIENLKEIDNDKEFIMIRAQDMFYVLAQLRNAYKWFNDPQYENLFATKNNKLIIYQNVDPIIISGLPMDKYIELVPIVVIYDNGTQRIGIRMSLSNPSNYVDIDIQKFEGLLYTLNNFNMYLAAQGMLNFLGRPEFGSNMYEFKSVSQEEQQGFVEGGIKREPKAARKNKSFFDKMDEL